MLLTESRLRSQKPLKSVADCRYLLLLFNRLVKYHWFRLPKTIGLRDLRQLLYLLGQLLRLIPIPFFPFFRLIDNRLHRLVCSTFILLGTFNFFGTSRRVGLWAFWGRARVDEVLARVIFGLAILLAGDGISLGVKLLLLSDLVNESPVALFFLT